MDEMGQDFFPGPAFAQNQDGYIQPGGSLDLLPDGLHPLRRSKIDVVGGQFGLIYGRFRLE